jgi:hypothetical protein
VVGAGESGEAVILTIRQRLRALAASRLEIVASETWKHIATVNAKYAKSRSSGSSPPGFYATGAAPELVEAGEPLLKDLPQVAVAEAV